MQPNGRLRSTTLSCATRRQSCQKILKAWYQRDNTAKQSLCESKYYDPNINKSARQSDGHSTRLRSWRPTGLRKLKSISVVAASLWQALAGASSGQTAATAPPNDRLRSTVARRHHHCSSSEASRNDGAQAISAQSGLWRRLSLSLQFSFRIILQRHPISAEVGLLQ